MLSTSKSLFLSRNWFIYEHDLTNISAKEEHLTPLLPEMKYTFVDEVKEVEQLKKEGFRIPYAAFKDSERLERGAKAFCLFSGKDLIHIGWLCMTEEAKKSVTPVKYRLDFTKMAAIEEAETFQEKNGAGNKRHGTFKSFLAYSYFKRARYILESGKSIARYGILTGNLPSQRIVERLGARKISTIRLLRLLGFEIWNESPLKLAKSLNN